MANEPATRDQQQNQSQDTDRPMKLTEVMDHAVDKTEGSEKVTVGDILDSFGPRSYGPLLLIPSFIAMVPIIGAIPGVSIVMGTIILLISVQMLVAQSRPWIPQRIRNFSMSHQKLEKAVEKTRPWIKPVERLIRRRMTFLTELPFFYLIPVVSIVLALLFYPMAFVPWGVTLPGFAMLLLSIGLTARDGLLIALAYLFTGASLWLAITFWPF